MKTPNSTVVNLGVKIFDIDFTVNAISEGEKCRSWTRIYRLLMVIFNKIIGN